MLACKRCLLRSRHGAIDLCSWCSRQGRAKPAQRQELSYHPLVQIVWKIPAGNGVRGSISRIKHRADCFHGTQLPFPSHPRDYDSRIRYNATGCPAHRRRSRPCVHNERLARGSSLRGAGKRGSPNRGGGGEGCTYLPYSQYTKLPLPTRLPQIVVASARHSVAGLRRALAPCLIVTIHVKSA